MTVFFRGAAVIACCQLILSSAHGETFRQALIDAYTSNPDLLAAQAQLRSVDEGLSAAQSGFRPDLAIVGESSYSDFKTDVLADDLQTNEIGLQVTQNLYQGGGTLAEIRRARRSIEDQRALLDNSEQNVLLDAVTAYANLRRDALILEASLKNVERLEKQLEATQKRRDVLEATRTDLRQAEARVAGGRADLEQARANLEGSVAGYRRVIGTMPGELQTVPLPDNIPASLEEALARAADANPGIQALTARVKTAQADVDIANSSLLPRLDLQGDLTVTDEPSLVVDEQREATIGLVLNIPLYQTGAEYARIRQGKQIVIQRRRQLDSVRRSVEENTIRAFENLNAANRQVALFEQQVAANFEALDGVEKEALIGTRLILDILDAEDELFRSQVSLESATRDRAVAAYTLKSAVGELSAADLGLDVDIYDPQKNLERTDGRFIGVSID